MNAWRSPMYSVPLWVKAVWVLPVFMVPMQNVDGHCHCDPLGNGDSIDHHSLLTVAKEAVGEQNWKILFIHDCIYSRSIQQAEACRATHTKTLCLMKKKATNMTTFHSPHSMCSIVLWSKFLGYDGMDLRGFFLIICKTHQFYRECHIRCSWRVESEWFLHHLVQVLYLLSSIIKWSLL